VPAVVNLEGITRRLRDGQEVTVDGTRGVVWLHP
jgi:phosphohistidine swiveling domain-containing protein